MRDTNLLAVLTVLRDHGPITRAELVRFTGLSAPTVSALVSELVAAGIAGSGGEGPATGGRRGALIDLLAAARVVLAVDISTSPAKHALTDLRGDVIPGSASVIPSSAMRSPQHLVTWLGRRARMRPDIIGIGVAVPGVTDPVTGLIEWAPSLKWRSVDLGSMLRTTVTRLVVVDNDLNLAALGEFAFAGHELGDLVMLGVRGGFGAGIIVGGVLHRGVHYSAGEIGYLPYPGQPSARDFGALEAALFARPRPSGAEDPELVRLITYACITLGAVLDVQTIVLGDDITSRLDGLPDLVAEQLAATLPHPPKIACSALGEQASLRGAGFAVQQAAADDIRRILA